MKRLTIHVVYDEGSKTGRLGKQVPELLPEHLMRLVRDALEKHPLIADISLLKIEEA